MSSGDGPTFGPVQMMVLDFDRTALNGDILPELKRLKDAGIVRLIDLLVVRKPAGEDIEIVQQSDLSHDEAVEFGALVGALIGFGTGSEENAYAAAVAGADEMEDGHLFGAGESWYLADAIPEGHTAAVALIEHLWAIPLRDKILAAGGETLADEWVHPKDLLAVGAVAAELAAAN